jgi:integrase/recombinase XerD
MITISENRSYNIEELFDVFLKEKEGRIADTTIGFYNDYIGKFMIFLKGREIKTTDQLNIQIINYYIVWLNNNLDINTTSANIHLRAIRAFIYWMQKKEEIEIKNFQVQELPDDKRKEKEIYTEAELEKLLKKPNLQKTRFPTYRSWVIINFLLATGARRHTTTNMKIKDIDMENRKIKLFNFKRHRNYKINFYNNFYNVIKEYLQIRKGQPADFLFPTQYGTEMSVSGLTSAISRYNKSRGVEKTGIHAFRHTFASLWIKNGGDPYILSDLLDHSDMETTRIYVHQFQEDKRLETFNPLESIKNKNKKDYINL